MRWPGLREGTAARPAYRAGNAPGVERVTGIGGFFFRSDDPAALASWYEERLGVTGVPASYGDPPWKQQAGVTVFAPFPRDAPMIGPPEHSWMINFRVDDLDAIVTQLRTARETVDVDPQRYPNGGVRRALQTRRATACSSGSR